MPGRAASALIALLVFTSTPAVSNALEYPELQVTPSASDRLLMEAKEEEGRRWQNVAPLAIPAAMTLASGIYLKSENPKQELVNGVNPVDTASSVAIGVGAGWLATSYFLTNYEPYRSGWSDVKPLPKGSKQDQLTRERMAEEALERPAKLARRLTWLSVITNLGASVYVASMGGTYSSIVGGISGLMAFTPLLFPYHWQDVYNTHQDYKKKIYGPVAQMTLLPDSNGSLSPGVGINWSF